MNKAQGYDSATPRREVWHLHGRVVLDGSSVPVAYSAAAPSTSSDNPRMCRFVVTRTGAGVYVVTLQDKWLVLLNVNISVIAAGGAYAVTDGRFLGVVTADAVASTPSATVKFERPDTGAAADPKASSTLLVTVTVGNAE